MATGEDVVGVRQRTPKCKLALHHPKLLMEQKAYGRCHMDQREHFRARTYGLSFVLLQKRHSKAYRKSRFR